MKLERHVSSFFLFFPRQYNTSHTPFRFGYGGEIRNEWGVSSYSANTVLSVLNFRSNQEAKLMCLANNNACFPRIEFWNEDFSSGYIICCATFRRRTLFSLEEQVEIRGWTIRLNYERGRILFVSNLNTSLL